MQSLLDRRLPLRTRWSLVAADVRRKLARTDLYSVRYGPASVYLSAADFGVDRASFDFALVEATYATDYRDAVVVDIGSHKGYYAAYAVHHGARAVIAYEPEGTNRAVLERTAAGYRKRTGALWEIRQAAVDARAGRADLHLMSGSWAHALQPPPAFAQYEVGTESVHVVALGDVLDDGSALKGRGARLIVKINIEGAECTAIPGTPPGAWNEVDEVFVETHPWAECDAAALAQHLEPSGLRRAESAHPVVLRMRREGSSRSAARSDPR
jgi:FkbM family methyltransferase